MSRKLILLVTFLMLGFALLACQANENPDNSNSADNSVVDPEIVEPITSSIPENTPTKTPTNVPIETATNSPTIAPTATPEPLLGIGSTQIREIDGMEQVYVPAGEFIMGSEDGNDDEKPVRNVFLDAYWIDKYEVSTGQYQECVKAGLCTEPFANDSNSRSSYYGDSAYDNYPVIDVDWHQAKAYCEWAGGDLPTEAQWEKAARGDDARKYPWGNQEPESSYANYHKNINDTTKVGSYEKGASPYGSMDMLGNVWEWVNDLYADSYIPEQTVNPQGPSGTRGFRAVRGGGWLSDLEVFRSALRNWLLPGGWSHYIGFRCVSPP